MIGTASLFPRLKWQIFLLIHLFSVSGGSINSECSPEDSSADVPAYCTNEIAVRLKPGSDPDTIAARHNLHNHGQIGGLKNHYLLAHKDPSESVEGERKKRSASASVTADAEVEWLSGQIAKTRVKRGHSEDERVKRQPNLPWPDPLYRDQWFLHKGAEGNYDMWVTEAWMLGVSGKGVSVSILDDGIQPTHPDLKDNYDPEASYDVNDKDPDPTPQDDGNNKHGTRCAGEVAAIAGNNYCGVGVAYEAKIGGIRMLDGPVSDSVEAASLSHNQQHIDIYSASWGPEDDGRTFDGPGPLAKQAFIDGINTGRGGKGNIFIWASGNGGSHKDSCSCDGYTTSIYTLSVSAATYRNGKPWYLEECPSTIATTYSSAGAGEPAIVTTDMPNSCTRSHTGTSAAAPMAAGIVALALEANQNLTWRDMQHVVLRTAKPDALLANPGWSTNGVGRKISNKFGYGIMNAEGLVRLSRAWKTVPEQHSCTYEYDMKQQEKSPIPLKKKFSLNFAMEVKGCEDSPNPVLYLEQIQVIVTVRYSRRGDLNIFLQSPSGTKSELLPRRPGDLNASGFHKWPFLSVQQWGEDPRGTWTLTIENSGSEKNEGTFHGWSLLLFGTSIPAQQGDPTHESRGSSSGFTPPPRSSDEVIPDSKSGDDGSHPQGPVIFQGCHEECVAEKGCTALNSSSACIKCKNYGQNFRNRGGTKCLSKCDGNYYADETQKKCRQCLKACATCSGPDVCTSCHNGMYLVQADLGSFHHGQCLDSCPHEFKEDEADPSHLKCVIPCHVPHCAFCLSDRKCGGCNKGHYLVPDGGFCSSKCPPGTEPNSESVCFKPHSSSPSWLPLVIGACVAAGLLFVLVFSFLMCREKTGYRKLSEFDWESEMQKPGKNGFPQMTTLPPELEDDDSDEEGDALFTR